MGCHEFYDGLDKQSMREWGYFAGQEDNVNFLAVLKRAEVEKQLPSEDSRQDAATAIGAATGSSKLGTGPTIIAAVVCGRLL